MKFLKQAVEQTKTALKRIHIQALVVIIFAIGLTIGFLMKILEPQMYINVAMLAMGWLFGSLTKEKKNG